MTDRLDGKVAIITGAATGIGRALAIALRELALGTLLQPADGGDHDAHAQRYARTVRRLKGRDQ